MDRSVSQTSITPSELKRVESHQYPRTHVGHLNESQQAALASFKELSEKEGYYRRETQDSRASHDDETLLRYLRARKFQPQDALKQFKDTEQWRKKNKIDRLYDTIDVTEYDETRKLYPQWTGRRDKRGIPVYVFEVAPLTSKRMAEYDKTCGDQPAGNAPTSSKMLRLFALYENLIQFALPLCSRVADRPYPETPVSQSSNIVDISRVGLKQFWNLKGHMQDASQLATAYYPETLDRIFIIGAPSFFPTVWSWIKRWFDPITVSKIFILSQANVKSTLEQHMDIEAIPRKYGGTLDWEWGQVPYLEPSIDKVLVWHNPAKGAKGQNAFPPGPVRWKETENGDMEAIAVGSVDGKQRATTVATLKAQILDEKHIDLPPVGEDMFGAPLSGVHTHPRDDEEYFPSSGDTPTSEKEEPSIPTLSESGANDSSAENTHNPKANGGREGTSETRFAQQEYTLAAGQLADGTPEVVDHGHGDKAAVMDPRTVGQAPKHIPLPDAEASAEQGDATYVDQAKAAASSVYTTTTSVASTVGSKVMAVVGYGSQEDSAKKEEQEGEVETEGQAEGGAEDPRIEEMQPNKVEEFVRSQYTSAPPQNG